MILSEPAHVTLLSFAISLASVLWLGVCAWYDLRTRQVPNWLTLPAIPLALVTAWLVSSTSTQSVDSFLFHLAILTLPLFLAWYHHLLGGADLKVLLALSLADPRLSVAAWLGALLYFVGLLVLQRGRSPRFAGIPGFTLGTGLLTLGQLVVLLTPHHMGA